MSSWIKMRVDLHMDPRVMRISELVGIDVHGVVGRLHMLWSWISQQTLDGNARCVTRAHVDRVCAHDGFAHALERVGWLRVDDGSDEPGGEREPSISIPNWDSHNSQTARTRALTANRVKKNRVTQPLRSGNDDVTHDALPEKRREEKRRKQNQPPTPLPDSSDEPAAVGSVVVVGSDFHRRGKKRPDREPPDLSPEERVVADDLAGVLQEADLRRAGPLVREHTAQHVADVLAYARQVTPPPDNLDGFVISLLRSGFKPRVSAPRENVRSGAQILAEARIREQETAA